MDADREAQSSFAHRTMPWLGWILVGAMISVASAYVAYGLFPRWGINSPALQNTVASGGVMLGGFAALSRRRLSL